MIDTTKILPGQEFKNMQELSVALTGQKMPAGNRYVVRVNEMKKYLSWDKIPGRVYTSFNLSSRLIDVAFTALNT